MVIPDSQIFRRIAMELRFLASRKRLEESIVKNGGVRKRAERLVSTLRELPEDLQPQQPYRRIY